MVCLFFYLWLLLKGFCIEKEIWNHSWAMNVRRSREGTLRLSLEVTQRMEGSGHNCTKAIKLLVYSRCASGFATDAFQDPTTRPHICRNTMADKTKSKMKTKTKRYVVHYQITYNIWLTSIASEVIEAIYRTSSF